MNKQMIFTGAFSLLMIFNVQAAWRSLVKAPSRTAQADVIHLLRYRQQLNNQFLNISNYDFAKSLRETECVGLKMNWVDEELRKQGITFDPAKDSPEKVVDHLESKKVQAMGKRLEEMRLDFTPNQ